MARLKKLSKKNLVAQQNRNSDGVRMKRQPAVRVAETEAMEARRLDNRWTEWTPNEAYKELMKTMGAAGPDYIANLLKFVQESKRMYPGQTFGQLKDKIAIEYSQHYLSY